MEKLKNYCQDPGNTCAYEPNEKLNFWHVSCGKLLAGSMHGLHYLVCGNQDDRNPQYCLGKAG